MPSFTVVEHLARLNEISRRDREVVPENALAQGALELAKASR
jgi:hypothetical protein